MNRIFAICCALLLAAYGATAQSNQVKAAGVSYTNGAPNFTPTEKTASEIAIDTATGYLYQWHRTAGPSNAGTWLRIGQGIDRVSGLLAPAYAPARNQSWFAINAGDELYSYAGSGTTWNCLNCKVGGSGTSSQVPYFSGISTLSGSNNMTFDGTRLKLGTFTNGSGIQATDVLITTGRLRATGGISLRGPDNGDNILFGMFPNGTNLDIYGSTINLRNASGVFGTLSWLGNGVGNGMSISQSLTSNSSATGDAVSFRVAPIINNQSSTGVYYKGIVFDPNIVQTLGRPVYGFINTAGDNLLNTTSGNTGIGLINNSTPSAKLQVQGQGSTSSTYGLLVTNSGGATATASLAVRNDGRVGIGTNAPSKSLYIGNSGSFGTDATNTASGTTGAQTINKASGTVNFAAGATSLVVTNSLVSTSSIVFAVVRTNDTTATIKNVVPASGSFTINLGAAATAETSVGFFVIN